MRKEFSELSFTDLTALKSEVYQKMEWLKSKFPDELHKGDTTNLTEWGRLSGFWSNVCAEIDDRIANAVTIFFNSEDGREDEVKKMVQSSSVSWLIENAKSEKMSALGMSERALSDANEVAEDLSMGGRHDRAIAIHRLIRALFMSLDDVTFPKLDNG